MENDAYFSQWVEFDHALKRKSIPGKKPGEWKKSWVREKQEVTQGIVVGVRHLTNGENRFTDSGIVYTHKEFIVAYLVAVDLIHKHKLVLIQDAKGLK
jgi:hypothetical protein